MGTKTISIIDDAYAALKREKRADESFSDVILKLTNRRGKFADSFGKWKVSDEEAKKIQDSLDKAWKNWGHHKWTV
jgi:predicted CopG family antitoxin